MSDSKNDCKLLDLLLGYKQFFSKFIHILPWIIWEKVGCGSIYGRLHRLIP
jgi:hypothetical protein